MEPTAVRLPDQRPDVPLDPSDRLNGWKEIASFLGKGVRTVQRWEKELGLPVHRLGKDGGEIVFALKSEVQRWTLSSRPANGLTPGHGAVHPEAAEPDDLAPPSQSPALPSVAENDPAAPLVAASPRWIASPLGITGAGLLVGVLAFGAWRVGGAALLGTVGAGAAPQPAAWEVRDDALRVFGGPDHLLWQHRFPGGIDETAYAPFGDAEPSHVTIEDLDGDGAREVVLTGVGLPSREERKLYVFNADGSLRFTHQPTRTVQFGTEAYRPAWIARGFGTTKAPDGRTRLWAWFVHGAMFPSVLQEIDARGRVLSEYWSDGYISRVTTGTWRGRPVVLVSATNNEHKAASLAVFDAARVQGSAPAAVPEKRCTDCPPGRPLAFVVFPRSCLARRDEGQPYVYKAWTEPGDRIVTAVFHGEARHAGERRFGDIYYTLGADLAPERIDITREFLLVHDALWREGKLDHGWAPDEDGELEPLLQWDGSRFTPLPLAPVRR